ncbi:MAG: hypothetical protein M3Q95_00820 [Bacteroidota bacterium]|nr:hypothetical protein [Bacteroidota bacterium]
MSKNPKSFNGFIKHAGSILIVLVLMSLPVISQVVKTGKEFKYKLSSPYKVIDATTKEYFHEGNTIISVKFTDKDFYIQKFDTKTMREVSMREVTDLPDGWSFEGFLQLKDRVLFFYSLWDKKNKTEQLFSRGIEFEKGTFEATPTLVLSSKEKLTGQILQKGYSYSTVDKFDFDTSFDTTKLCIRYRKKPETKNDSKSYDEIGFNVFSIDGNKLTKLWSKEVKMPYTEQKMDTLGFTVDAEGNSYLLAKVHVGEGKGDKDKDGNYIYTMEIIKVDAKTLEHSIIKVDLAARYVTDVKLTETKDNGITVMGYYCKEISKKAPGVEGLFMSKLSKSGQLENIKSYDIPLEVINQNISKKKAAKNTKSESKDEEEGAAQLERLLFSDFIKSADGSITIVGQQFQIKSHTTTSSSGGTRTTYTYHYNDMLITKINADGTLAWMRRLPKNQYGTRNPGGLSYKNINSQNHQYYLFLDNLKNLNLPIDQVPARHIDGAGGILTAYKIDEQTGEVSKVSIFDMKNVNGTELFQFATSRILKVSPTDFMVETYKKNKEDVMVKISLTELAN